MTKEERAAAARLLVSFRKRTEGACEVCGKQFTGYANGSRRRRFCGADCRARAHYLATKAERKLLAPASADAASGEEGSEHEA